MFKPEAWPRNPVRIGKPARITAPRWRFEHPLSGTERAGGWGLRPKRFPRAKANPPDAVAAFPPSVLDFCSFREYSVHPLPCRRHSDARLRPHARRYRPPALHRQRAAGAAARPLSRRPVPRGDGHSEAGKGADAGEVVARLPAGHLGRGERSGPSGKPRGCALLAPRAGLDCANRRPLAERAEHFNQPERRPLAERAEHASEPSTRGGGARPLPRHGVRLRTPAPQSPGRRPRTAHRPAVPSRHSSRTAGPRGRAVTAGSR